MGALGHQRHLGQAPQRVGSAFYVPGLKILLRRKEKRKCLGLRVHEEVDASVMLKMCSGIRLWLGMDLSLYTRERMAVSRHHDGVWIGVWTRSYLAVGLREVLSGRHPFALGSTPISLLWGC